MTFSFNCSSYIVRDLFGGVDALIHQLKDNNPEIIDINIRDSFEDSDNENLIYETVYYFELYVDDTGYNRKMLFEGYYSVTIYNTLNATMEKIKL